MSAIPPTEGGAQGDEEERRAPAGEVPETPVEAAPVEPYANLFSRDEVARTFNAADQADHDDDQVAEAARIVPSPTPVDDETEEEVREPGSARRSPMVLIAVSALLLVTLGVGLGYSFAPQPATPTATAQPLAAVATPFPTPDLPQPVDTLPDEQVIARVGETQLTFGDFKRSYAPGEDPGTILTQMIQIELVVQAALDEGAAVDQAQVDAQIEEIKQGQAGGDDAQFLAFLQQNDIASVEDLRDLLARQQLIEAAMLQHTLMEQARARHILLSATADTLEARKSEAEALLAQLEDGADFAALAREKSEDPGSKDAGGELGWAPRGIFVEEFDTAIFAMQPGELRLVSTQFGWHIIELLDAAELRPLEDSQYIQTPAGQEAFATTFLPWVEQLQSEAETDGRVERLVDPATLVTD